MGLTALEFLEVKFMICCMKYVPNQNGKVMEEILAGFISDAVKATLKCLRHFKMTLSLLQVFQMSLPIPLSLCHIQ